jgi:2'-hydroxyisoflavone reductase
MVGSVVEPLYQDEAVTYWPVRIAQGGEMMAVGDPSWPIQFIDVRDLAAWAVQMLEKRSTGIYNTVGPMSSMTLGQMIKAAQPTTSAPPPVTWVSAPWLLAKNGDQTWNVLLFWYGTRQIMRMSISRALQPGFRPRPASVTMSDALRWHQNEPSERRGQIITSYKKKADGSGWDPSSMPWSGYLEREMETLAAWHAEQHEHG